MAPLCLKPFSILGEGNKRSSARSAFSLLLPPLCFHCFVCHTPFEYTYKELMTVALAYDDMKSIEVTCSPFREYL